MNTTLVKNGITAKMSDEEFFHFCMDNPDLRIERASNLEVVIMSPVGSKTSGFEFQIAFELEVWNRSVRKGIVFNSNAGFTLPDRSVLSPDAAWMSREKWNSISTFDQSKFAPVCPEFVVEVYSSSDRLIDIKRKMKRWIANGAQLAWLIDPTTQTYWIYRPEKEPEKVEGFDEKLRGEPPVEGFVLDLSLLKN